MEIRHRQTILLNEVGTARQCEAQRKENQKREREKRKTTWRFKAGTGTLLTMPRRFDKKNLLVTSMTHCAIISFICSSITFQLRFWHLKLINFSHVAYGIRELAFTFFCSRNYFLAECFFFTLFNNNARIKINVFFRLIGNDRAITLLFKFTLKIIKATIRRCTLNSLI